jgi:ABC-type transporter Mla subunit MlaD
VSINASSIVGTVNTVIDMIQKFLPLIHKDDSGTIDKIIDTVQALSPLVVDQIGDTYTGVKNIIDSIGEHPATTAQQIAALDAFSEKVDAAWDAIEDQFDPDSPKTA